MQWTIRRLARLQKIVAASSYLEIGVQTGRTFNALDFEQMDAVDPRFLFDYRAKATDSRRFFETTSDNFFLGESVRDSYDLIFIDGLHTYDQTYRDFCHSVSRSSCRSLIVIDDVFPCDRFAVKRSQAECISLRRSKAPNSPFKAHWQGDVYKMIVLLALFHKNFNYATISDGENYQTVVWPEHLSASSKVSLPFEPFVNDEFLIDAASSIKGLKYKWIIKNQGIYNLCEEEVLMDYLEAIYK